MLMLINMHSVIAFYPFFLIIPSQHAYDFDVPIICHVRATDFFDFTGITRLLGQGKGILMFDFFFFNNAFS